MASAHAGHGGHVPVGGGRRALLLSGLQTGIYFVIELGLGLWSGLLCSPSETGVSASPIRADSGASRGSESKRSAWGRMTDDRSGERGSATLESRVPILHFFDGFRTSHEVNKIAMLLDAQIRAMISDDLVRAHRARALTPEHPVVRGTAHNPDTFFQARETANAYYARAPAIVQATMERFAAHTGHAYKLFEYEGARDADRVIVVMGSGAETARETAMILSQAGERVGVLQVRLSRPFSVEDFLAALPDSCRAVAVIEQTKEPGAPGEPLYIDVVTTLAQAFADGKRKTAPRVVGGRYGLGSENFNPAQAKAVFDEMKKPNPRNGFTVGIEDDVSHTSLAVDPAFSIERDDMVRALFFGLGASPVSGAPITTRSQH